MTVPDLEIDPFLSERRAVSAEYGVPLFGKWLKNESLTNSTCTLEFGDQGVSQRKEWIRQILHPVESADSMFDYSLPTQAKDFTVLLFSGGSAATVAGVLAHFRDALADKKLVSLRMAECPDEKAVLLRAGADDVLHIGMDPAVARRRLEALAQLETAPANVIRWPGGKQRIAASGAGPAGFERMRRDAQEAVIIPLSDGRPTDPRELSECPTGK